MRKRELSREAKELQLGRLRAMAAEYRKETERLEQQARELAKELAEEEDLVSD